MLGILYEDDHLIAVNKIAGVIAVPAPGVPEEKTIMGAVREHFKMQGIKPYPLHRLDQKTSGVMLFGKFPRDREKLEAIFGAPETHKIYFALVKGRPKPAGIITAPLESRYGGKKIPAKTTYKTLKIFDDYSLVAAEIHTGRKHQIRKHFSFINHQLVNDSEYGDRPFNRIFQKKFKTHYMFLHAAKIAFRHPFANTVLTIEAPLPKHFEKLI